MASRGLKSLDGAALGIDRIEALRSAFRGQLVSGGDTDYETGRRIWNASIDRHPGVIARCAGVADVVEAVNFARENGVLVAVRGGGHNVGGRALCDDGMVIDLSRMKGIHVDAHNRRARVQGGALLGDVDRETHLFGLAVPTGIISKTGIAGLTLGGGVGWLVRKYGLTCDNVLSFEIVTADGKVLIASAAENKDLFWALRGGGGNFGVVTSFEYRLHPVSTVLGGLILYPRDQATTVLRHYREFMKSAPDELAVYAGLLSAPDGTPVVALIACHCGELEEGEAALKPLRALGTPLMDAIQPMPFPKMQSLLDGGFPDGALNYWKSAFLRELGDDAIQTVIDHANRALSPQTAVVLEYYGGAAGRVGASETAFAHREAAYSLGILCRWTDPAESPRQIAWTRGFAEAMRPYYSGAYLLNFLDAEEHDTIRAAFGSNYDRLVAVKNRYDPTNFFHLNQNIKPTA